MQTIQASIKTSKPEIPKYVIYLLVFLFTLHMTPTTYIDSSFIEQFIGADFVGYIFTIASTLTLFSFVISRKILIKIGNYNFFLISLLLEFVSLFIMSLSLVITDGVWPYIFIISYIISFVVRSLCFLNLDIFLEHTTSTKETGSVRGVFLTSSNMAFVIGPFIAGLLIVNVLDLGKIYLLSWVILIPVIVLAIRSLNNFRDIEYQKIGFRQTFFSIFKNSNLRNIFATNFLLNFFYSWMIIYTPIFLTKFIGFSLSETATIISIALIPFILLQYPMGKIADKYLGEKEILTAGFIIAGLTTILMSFSQNNSFIFWSALLFTTRIGASMIEIMIETHLFKKINDDSINILGFFRSVRPVAYIISPIIASLFLIWININYLFLVLGVILILGTGFSLAIKDTK